ncbi:MAG: NAD-dependent epimerase/dehydratase family protein [Pirellulales bacterium]
MRTTLVTGATGLVGNNVVRRLLEAGQSVRVLVRASADPRPLADLDGLEIVEGDVRDPQAVARAVHGAVSVIHAAAFVHIGWTGLDAARAINVEGTRNVAKAALAERARLVHVSSIDALGLGANGAPADEESVPVGGVLCPYVVTKRESEQVVLNLVEQGLAASIVNPGYMIGPYDWKPSSGRMLLSVARGWGLLAPLGINCYCDVRDVVSGILAALEHGRTGRRYILGGQMLTYFQAWRIFAEVAGATPPVFPIGPVIRYGAGHVGDLVGRITGREPDVNSASTAIAAQKRNFSSARAQAELGYRPRHLRDAAADAWRWFRQNGYA